MSPPGFDLASAMTLGDRIDGQLRACHQHEGGGQNLAHRREILHRVVRHRAVERRRDRVTAGRQQQRVAVGRRFRDGVGADVAARAGAIFDDDGLAEMVRHLGRDDPPDRIDRAAGGERHHDADGPVRIALRDPRGRSTRSAATTNPAKAKRRRVADRIGFIPASESSPARSPWRSDRCPPCTGRRTRRASCRPAPAPVETSHERTCGSASALAAYSWMVFTTSGGVPAGANSDTQLPTSRPLKPCSSAVGTSGIASIRLVPVTPSPRMRLLCTLRDAVGLRQEGELDVVRDQRGDHRRVAAIGDVHELDAGDVAEHLGEQVQRGAGAARTVVVARRAFPWRARPAP